VTRISVKRFTATVEPVPHGGLFVVVPSAVAEGAKLAHGARVRGTVDGVPYRSSLMKYSGVFHLGVHKATAEAAGVQPGDQVRVTIAADDAPRPTDRVPEDLAHALARNARAEASWSRLAPAVRRGYVRQVLDAKRDATRLRRIGRIVEMLHAGVPPRRTWSPPRASRAARQHRS
jgi:hypothetical protein